MNKGTKIDLEKPNKGEPFSMYFVYTSDGKITIYTGDSDNCKRKIDNLGPCLYYYSYWKNKQQRGSWIFSGVKLHWTQESSNRKRTYWLLKNYKFEILLTVRRVPRRWLKIYNSYCI